MLHHVIIRGMERRRIADDDHGTQAICCTPRQGGERDRHSRLRCIHSNPLRVKLVADLRGLEGYPYCGHGVILRTLENQWQDKDSVLSQFGNREGDAKSAYRRFVGEGVELGRRPELVGRGLIRSVRGWAEVKSQRRRRKPELVDERILGSGDFVERVIREAGGANATAVYGRERGRRVERLIAEECKKRKVSLTKLRSGSRGVIPALRGRVSRKLVEDYGIPFTAVAR